MPDSDINRHQEIKMQIDSSHLFWLKIAILP